MKRRDFIRLSAAALAGTTLAYAAPSPKRPNIIFIMADDLGFEALGAYGAKATKGIGPVKTPNLDALAAAGMRFTQCFSCPVCSPARSEILSGRYNCVTGFIDIAGRNGAVNSLDAQKFPTLPAALKAAGYITAVSGKWHLGEPSQIIGQLPPASLDDSNSEHVRSCGFDRQYVFGGAHLRAYGKPVAGEYTPEWFQKWALRFMESRKSKSEPFFLYYPSPIPHFPLLPTPLNPNGGIGNPVNNPATGGTTGNQENYPYVIEYLDGQVGEVVKKLDELGMRENTLLMFSGDNGTNVFTTEMRDGREVKGGKGSMNDTGAWVPLIASWPGTVAPGSVCERLVEFTDLMPTFLELAGAPAPAVTDGVSFAPQLQGKKGPDKPWVHVHYVNRWFVRDNHWKLRENGELYDITGSPYEEKLIAPEADTAESKAARARLQAVLDRLHPEGPPKETAPAKKGKKAGKNAEGKKGSEGKNKKGKKNQ